MTALIVFNALLAAFVIFGVGFILGAGAVKANQDKDE